MSSAIPSACFFLASTPASATPGTSSRLWSLAAIAPPPGAKILSEGVGTAYLPVAGVQSPGVSGRGGAALSLWWRVIKTELQDGGRGFRCVVEHALFKKLVRPVPESKICVATTRTKPVTLPELLGGRRTPLACWASTCKQVQPLLGCHASVCLNCSSFLLSHPLRC